jgi:hypothetical protein
VFYCEACQASQQWPPSLARSRGTCETCGQPAMCYDTPSARLPLPPGQSKPDVSELERSQRYWVKFGDGDWHEVSRQDYAAAERRAGFRPQGEGDLATSSFSGYDSSKQPLNGRTTSRKIEPGSYARDPEFARAIGA